MPLDWGTAAPPPRHATDPPPVRPTTHTGRPIDTWGRKLWSERQRGDAGATSVLRVLGVDPGSQVTGYGVVERRGGALVHVAHGTLRAPQGASPATRLDRLYTALCEVIALHRPDAASIEQVFVARSPRAALVLGQARGVAMAALGAAGLGVDEYAPARIKQSVTGNGRAAKAQVQRVVRQLLTLERLPASDAADALAAAICHAQAGPLAALGARSRPRRTPRRGPVVHVRRSP